MAKKNENNENLTIPETETESERHREGTSTDSKAGRTITFVSRMKFKEMDPEEENLQDSIREKRSSSEISL